MQSINETPKATPMRPATPDEFDRAYRAPLTFWGDFRVPKELKALAEMRSDQRSLELGCGVGRFSRYLAQQGLRATAVDFSPVAISKAREACARDDAPPDFSVGDVTHLQRLSGPFDFAFDVGCFHCLGTQQQKAYVGEVFRLLKRGGIHLIWALDSSPSEISLSPNVVRAVFAPQFELQAAETSRRRLARSHWYWLRRAAQ